MYKYSCSFTKSNAILQKYYFNYKCEIYNLWLTKKHFNPKNN